MAFMTVVTGDAPNVLLAQLDADLAAAPLPPLEDERIVIQSLGMERWVRQQLALRRGCAASLDMPFPAAFCRTLAEQLERRASGAAWVAGIDARFEEQALIWRVFALLRDDALLSDPVYAPLHAFVANSDDAKRYGLALRIASRLDEYRLYRPDLLLGWEDGREALTANPHEAWQAALWRRLLNGERPPHFARWFLHTIHALEQATEAPAGLPARVSVFGVSTLPPLFVRLLRAVSRFVPVRVYVLAPDATSWQPDAARHPLFELFGQASRELLTTLTAPDAQGVRPAVMHVSTPAPWASDTLLHRVQHDLRAARLGPVHTLDPHDRSLTVHVCYSPLREMEGLRDQLLDAFAADPSLRPHDVLVMVPDVELYAPLAEAIFGDAHEAERPAIPYRVADRTLVREAAPARALMQYLALVHARCSASEVMGLLSAPVVRRAADLSPPQLEQVTGWIEEAAIRWGYDGASRAATFGLPAVDDNSWRQGLDRLLAGYATGHTPALVAGVRPVGGDLLGDTELLGRFVSWVDQLFASLARLRDARSLAAWSSTLQEVARWLIKADGADELAAFDRLLRDLTRLGDLTTDGPGGARTAVPRGAVLDPHAPVSFDVVRRWLETVLATDEHGNNFLTGGVTICAMKPMRAIPHRVIAMLGLDDKAYPRRTRRSAFDLIGSEPRVGDRDPRADDRQLVLDTLMSAGDRLLLSYVGRSQKNNAEIAPSIVIAELLDFADTQCAVSANPPAGAAPAAQKPRKPSAWLSVAHRLQPFSGEYYRTDGERDARLFSFDAALAASVRMAANPLRPEAPPFVAHDARVPMLTRDLATVKVPPERQAMTVDDLVDAWCNPARLYCRRVLQLHVRSDDPVLEDVEPMEVGPLLSTRVQQGLLERQLARQATGAADRERLVAEGLLPSGALGPQWYDALQRDVAPLLGRLGSPPFREPFVVEVHGPDWTLTGQLAHQLDGEQWRVRAATLKARDKARAWIAHVVRNAAGGPCTTRIIGKDSELVLRPLPNALEQLDLLVQGYREALAAPMPYFLEAACAYRKATRTRNGDPVGAARKAYEADGSFGSFGDLCDEYVATLWRGRDPLGDSWNSFAHIADAFWTLFDDMTNNDQTARGA